MLAGVLMALAIAGCFLPLLPGPPLAYLSLLALHFTQAVQFSTNFLLLWAVVVIIVTVLDHFIPIWGTKKFGGTKAGMWGAGIGLVLGAVFIPPLGIIGGTLLGALIGELAVNPNDLNKALQSALGALIGFVLGIALKLSVTLVMAFYLVKEMIQAL